MALTDCGLTFTGQLTVLHVAKGSKARSRNRADKTILTILGGTTIADHAAIVRAECREGSHVELRRQAEGAVNGRAH